MKPVDPSDPATRTRPGAGAGDDEPMTEPRVSGAIVVDDPTRVSGAYVLGEVLGRGGMGEVLLAHDRKVGRDVALKRLRSGSPSDEDVSRFLREARIQARLDHPAIVPVYEIGRDHADRPYFTMKRLAGAPLAHKLGNEGHERLLRAFADVCRAIDFAHSKGVVHRDLKPSNVILGDFGEVYVIDWGIARVIGDVEGIAAADIDTLESSSLLGQVVGTPGYIAPEQLENPDVDRPADVYALGAILFEILAREPLHPRGVAGAASTLAQLAVASPAARRPDRQIAPELDELCVAMLARTPVQRPSARRCAERIEHYLDGDRDLARRRSMAVDLVWQARMAFDQQRRADAMRSASRALALDPEAGNAAEIVTTLLLEPPAEPSRELAGALRAADLEDTSRHARAAIPGYLMIGAFFPIVVGVGVLRWVPVVAVIVAAIALAVGARALVRRPDRAFGWMVGYAIANAALYAIIARLFGPLLVVPALVSITAASVITYPQFLDRPWVLMASLVGALLVPMLLEITGIWPAAWQLRAGGLLLRNDAIRIGSTAGLAAATLANVAAVVMAGFQFSVRGQAKRDAQHRLVAYAWHLQQLLPAPSATRA